jgi:radical SAM protein with 4Fe4S-binding SPASM domain
MLLHEAPTMTVAPPLPLRALTLTVTERCNLRCSYCYVPAESRRTLTAELADAAVDLLLRHRARPRASLFFFGGEPWLAAGLVRRAADRVGAGRDGGAEGGAEIGMTTNGTLLDREALAWCRTRCAKLAVSVDGRVGPHERVSPAGVASDGDVISRLPAIARLEPDCQVTARMTVTPANVEGLAENVQALGRTGVSRIVFQPAYELGWDELALGRWAREHRRIGIWLTGLVGAGRRPPVLPNWQGVESRLVRGRPRRPCGAGTRLAAVSTDGTLYPCYRFVFAEDADEYVLGDVGAGFVRHAEIARMHAIQPETLRPEEGSCADCPARDGCTFFCPALGHWLLRDPHGVPAVVCRLMRAQVDAIRPFVGAHRPRRSPWVARGAWATAAAFTTALSAVGAASCSSVETGGDGGEETGGLCPVWVDGGDDAADADDATDASEGGVCPIQLDAGDDAWGPGQCPVLVDGGDDAGQGGIC